MTFGDDRRILSTCSGGNRRMGEQGEKSIQNSKFKIQNSKFKIRSLFLIPLIPTPVARQSPRAGGTPARGWLLKSGNPPTVRQRPLEGLPTQATALPLGAGSSSSSSPHFPILGCKIVCWCVEYSVLYVFRP